MNCKRVPLDNTKINEILKSIDSSSFQNVDLKIKLLKKFKELDFWGETSYFLDLKEIYSKIIIQNKSSNFFCEYIYHNHYKDSQERVEKQV